MDEPPGRLEILANKLCLDLFSNYSHNPGFSDIDREAYCLDRTAQFIRAHRWSCFQQ